jgi:hypothetical protein
MHRLNGYSTGLQPVAPGRVRIGQHWQYLLSLSPKITAPFEKEGEREGRFDPIDRAQVRPEFLDVICNQTLKVAAWL